MYNESEPQEPVDDASLKNRTSQLEIQSTINSTKISTMLLRIDLIEANLPQLTISISDIIADINIINTQINSLNINSTTFQTQFTTLSSQITTIQQTINNINQGGVVELIDLCNNHKEILIRLSDNSLVGLYKKHSLRQFPEGSYKTKDGENCRFEVDSDLVVSW